MQNASACLDQAMFIAAESYSGSTYGLGFFEDMDEDCDPVPGQERLNVVLLAA